MRDEVTLKMGEAKKLGIIQETLAGRMTVATAAQALKLSERQIYRLRAKVKIGGEIGIVHGLRKRTPVNALSTRLREKILDLYNSKYKKHNFTHFTEVLNEEERIQTSRETVRKILRSEGKGGQIRKTKKHRKRRLRKAREGEMVFLDGSPHHWFGDEHPPCTLLLSCDDATGGPLVGLFRKQEDRDGCFLLLEKLFKKYGLPQMLYLDKASQFKTTRYGGVHSLQVKEEQTQFQRAMEELGIAIIFSHSPQARGRIERMNGTFQDRLVAELHSRSITTIPEANQYLKQYFIPAYRRKFGLAPRETPSVWRSVPAKTDFFDTLCVKDTRVVGNDNTLSYQGQTIQLYPTSYRHHFVKAKVEIRDRPDGKLHVYHPQSGKIPSRRLRSERTT